METSLSDLPEDLIHHIFSYIDDLNNNRTAIGLGMISKQFQSVLQKRPTLILEPNNVRLKLPTYYQKELDYVLSTLDRYNRENILLETFILEVYPGPGQEIRLYNQCIEFAAKKGLRKLDLWMSPDFVLPKHVFEVKSLVELNLSQCCLIPGSIVAWPNLKLLKIGRACVADEEAFQHIVRGCPSIEYLKFNVLGFTAVNFRVPDLRNLKKLNFRLAEDQRLEVNATPNSEYIKCQSIGVAYDNDKYLLGFNGNEYPSLRNLSVTGAGDLDENFFNNFAHRFPRVEKMYLQICETLQIIKLSSKSLKEIKLADNAILEEAYFDVPNLVRFDYSNDEFAVPKLRFSGNLGKWSSCIKLTELETSDHDINIDASRFVELNDFLATANMFETSVTVGFYGKRVVVFDEAHQAFANLDCVPVIKEFSIYMCWPYVNPSSVSAILDAIFSICRPQTMTFQYCNDHESYRLFPKLFYEKLVSRSIHPYLRVTNFEMFGTSEDFEI